MKVPESLPKLLQAVKWSCRDDVAQVSSVNDDFCDHFDSGQWKDEVKACVIEFARTNNRSQC